MTDIELMHLAAEIAGNTRCWIGIGCVIAKDGKILAEAWNETLPGEEYCREFRNRRLQIGLQKGLSLPYGKESPYQKLKDNAGCVRYELRLKQGENPEKVCSVHAEANAIALSARKGTAISGATMFVTSFPCLICVRSIIAAGIKKVVYMNDFYKPHHEEMFKNNGIEVQQVIENDVWKDSGHSVLDTESI